MCASVNDNATNSKNGILFLCVRYKRGLETKMAFQFIFQKRVKSFVIKIKIIQIVTRGGSRVWLCIIVAMLGNIASVTNRRRNSYRSIFKFNL